MATSPEPTSLTTTGAEAPTGAKATTGVEQPSPFEVTLANFSGPFDLLLSLIAKHQLDVTEVALGQVTDEFIAHLAGQEQWDLDEASEFLVVAATLLDLKAARLLPTGTVEDEEDLALLEARDLLFARLLQYRAFKEVADDLAERWEHHGRSVPRSVGLESHFAALLPELILEATPQDLAELAAKALSRPTGPPQVAITHLHHPVVPVAEQAQLLAERLRRRGEANFRELVHDALSTAVVVSRFLALLELFRSGDVRFDQPRPLDELVVNWSGSATGDIKVVDDYDRANEAGREQGGQ